jgi:hypothetical protein
LGEVESAAGRVAVDIRPDCQKLETPDLTPFRAECSLFQLSSFAQIIKVFGKPEGEERRYSPPEVIEMKKTAALGNPDLDIATTSHVERQNLTIRMAMRRMTRRTNAFSKKWDNLNHSYALHFFYYSFMRAHSSLRVTPAMESKLTDHIWTWQESLTHGF